MKNAVKKYLAGLLLFTMCLGFVPLSAFAAETGETLYEPGTYTVTANLFVPGERNEQLPGVAVYLTNPNNPPGIDGGEAAIPNEPVADNAALAIGEDGSKTLTLDVANPVFTLQEIGDGTTVHVQSTTRDDQVYSVQDDQYSKEDGSVTNQVYSTQDDAVSRHGRITQIVATLDDDSDAYTFSDCVVFSTLAGEDWTGPLNLEVDFSHIPLKTQDDEANKPEAASGIDMVTANAGTGETYEPGTYTVTANLFIPGELNEQLPGVTAYMTNPNNPLGIGGHFGIPNTPVADNAILVIGEDGSKTIILDVVNPVFTLQQIKDGTNVHIAGMVRDNVIYSGNTGVSRKGRIIRLYITLDDTSGTYTFSDCVEFPTLLETDWNVPLNLGVDFASALKTSDSTEVNLPEDPSEPEPGGNEVVITPDTPGEVNIEVPSGAMVTVNVAALLGAPANGKVSATLPALNITANTSVSAEPIEVRIPAGTVVSAPEDWSGTINTPTVRPDNSVTVTPDSGKSATVNTVIEIGFGDVPLTFDRAVRLLIPGQAGKDAGYSRGGVFTKITNLLSEDSQAAGDALVPGGDGKIDVGDDDLAIWTKHFTSFVTYTQTQSGGTPSPGDGTELKPGTYTVTANIFLKKQDTKLPLNPHLTSGVFPPKDPVSDNAKLIVAEDGTAKVIVPIPITVMTLNSISGLDIIDTKKDASGAIKSLTINLGRLDNAEEIITEKCRVSVTLSELAQSISGLEPDQNWPATFELHLSGAPDVDSDPFDLEDYLKDKNAALDPVDLDELEAGTYRITANLYLPGELNAQLPGVTAYMTNPNNPLGVGGHTGIPDTPVKDNGTLVVGEDGSKTIILDVVNPVFTLQQIKDGTNVHIAGTVRDNEIYSGNTGVSRTGRIIRLYITLDDTGGTYTFSDCVEFPTLLETEWNVPLKLGVDFAGALKTSDSTEVNLPEELTDPVPTNLTEPGIPILTGPEPAALDEKLSHESSEAEDTKPETKTVYVTRLKPGTYTVTANIFLKKEDTKLPMNPHLTSGVFPPKDPVSDNAKLIVAEDGTAKVIIPITITVMTLNSISGLDIVDMEKDGSGAIKSLTINLGRLNNPGKSMTKRCKVSVTLSELAQSISGFEPDQNWPATFKLDLAGVPTVRVAATVDVNGPRTGDDTPFAGYLVLMLVSLGGIGCLTFRRKRHAS